MSKPKIIALFGLVYKSSCFLSRNFRALDNVNNLKLLREAGSFYTIIIRFLKLILIEYREMFGNYKISKYTVFKYSII